VRKISGWTAKADAATEIITWLGIVIGALILVLWFFRTGIGMQTDDVEVLDKDLLQLQLMFDEACVSMRYEDSFNPLTERGIMDITDQVCVELKTDEGTLTRCIKPVCQPSPARLDLAELKEIVISKNTTVVASGR
jgi:hypothetical protein